MLGVVNSSRDDRDMDNKLKTLVFVIVSFLFGFFISPTMYPKLFGYKYQEECLINLQSSNQLAAVGCLRLYPSIDDKD
jgi:hypothetical protein